MEWTFKNGVPIYQQIIQTMQIRIAGGIYAKGEKLPAVRELAIEAGVNPNTMQRALAELERDRILYTARTSGRFVTEDEKVLENLRHDLSMQYIRELYEKLEQLGMRDDEIETAVRDFRKKQRTADN